MSCADCKSHCIVLELTVRNHPGTMSHITGLFSRRAYNLEGILCAPMGDGTLSRMYLLMDERPRLDQVEKQLARLHDVLEVRQRPDFDERHFTQLCEL